MEHTKNYSLKKPLDNETAEIQDIRDNMDAIDAALASMIPKAQKGATGGVAELGSDGKVPEAQLPPMNFDPAGSAAAVQENLNDHTNNKSNPHGTTAAQVGAYAKEEALSAAMKTLYGIPASGTPSDVFAAIRPLITKATPVLGTYNGTSERETQTINLGFTPSAVIVIGIRGLSFVAFALSGFPAKDGSNTVEIVANGFNVSWYGNEPPGSYYGEDMSPYRYVAFR